MKNKEYFERELSIFRGTQNYHKFTLREVVATDGIAYLIKNYDTHWLFSDMAIAWFMKIKKAYPEHSNFLVWNIKISEDNSAVVTAHWDCEEDGSFSNEKKVYEQKYRYVDFKKKTGQDHFSWYSQRNVFMLKTEY